MYTASCIGAQIITCHELHMDYTDFIPSHGESFIAIDYNQHLLMTVLTLRTTIAYVLLTFQITTGLTGHSVFLLLEPPVSPPWQKLTQQHRSHPSEMR